MPNFGIVAQIYLGEIGMTVVVMIVETQNIASLRFRVPICHVIVSHYISLSIIGFGNFNYSMNRIWHNHKFIQFYKWEMLRYFKPIFLCRCLWWNHALAY